MGGRARFFSFSESDINEAQAVMRAEYFTARSVLLLDPESHYEFTLSGVSVGAMTLGCTWYNSGIEVVSGVLNGCYYLKLPLSGTMQASHRGQTRRVAPGRAALFQPAGPVHMRTSDDYRSLSLRVDAVALRSALEELLDHPIPDNPGFDLDVELARGPGLGWGQLLMALAEDAARPDGLFSQPMVAAPLVEAILAGWLYSAAHRWREELESPVAAWGPRPIDRAAQLMHDHPELVHTPASLAAATGLGVRALHAGFRRHLDTTPMTYLSSVRLHRAHQDLRHGRAAGLTVTDIAHRWGFTHLSRFAQAYRLRYHQGPSDTLNRSGCGDCV